MRDMYSVRLPHEVITHQYNIMYLIINYYTIFS